MAAHPALSDLSAEEVLRRIEKRTAIGPKVVNSLEIPFSNHAEGRFRSRHSRRQSHTSQPYPNPMRSLFWTCLTSLVACQHGQNADSPARNRKSRSLRTAHFLANLVAGACSRKYQCRCMLSPRDVARRRRRAADHLEPRLFTCARIARSDENTGRGTYRVRTFHSPNEVLEGAVVSSFDSRVQRM